MALIEQLSHKPSLKRHLWLVSLLFPMTPLLGVGFALMSGHPRWVWLPVVIFYFFMPLLDFVMGRDKHDLLGLIEAETEVSGFYRFMVHMLLPSIYVTWIIGAWFAATQSLPIDAYIALGVAHGWGLGFAINAGHETGHKTDKLSKWIALLMLTPSFYGHFRIEHNRGHHSDVATPKDHATARFGESFWAFIPREYLGTWKRSWAIETQRAARRGHSKVSLKNEVVLSVALGLLVWGGVLSIFGIGALPYMLIAWVISVTALSAQNYIAHYGLLRTARPNGKFMPCEPQHSWNCDSLLTNLTTFNLARHSDHHANPARHYQHLRQFPEAPHLPYGYMTMYWIAYIPPLFRKVMNPRVLANVGGDMNKVLTPQKVREWEQAQKATRLEKAA